MARYKLYIEYEGTRYVGWQFQKNMKTIQGSFFDAVEDGFQSNKFEFYGAGRTDAGVHALQQVAHLDIDTNLYPNKVQFLLNDRLPGDISVLHVEQTLPDFHARYSATARSYIYIISRRRTAFGKPFVWWVKDKIDTTSMEKAAIHFVGMHDFASFSDDDPEEKSTKVDLRWIDIYEINDTIIIHVVASHFLHKMVRRLVGVLAEVGRGYMKPDDVKKLLLHKDPIIAKYTAPPSGLFLERVYYGDEIVERGEGSFYCPFLF
ncbi:MAG: tRNA pseudouridine(38-40) synthase TruA [Cytophagales bacterium]|nr:tRNA pseudouridine(38-40) synthase TruA [Cytophagales bacterium]